MTFSMDNLYRFLELNTHFFQVSYEKNLMKVEAKDEDIQSKL